MGVVEFDGWRGFGDRLLEREYNALYRAISMATWAAPHPWAAQGLEAIVTGAINDGEPGDSEVGWSCRLVRGIRDSMVSGSLRGAADAVLARLEPGSRPRRAQQRRSRR